MGEPEIGYHPGSTPENNVLTFLQRHRERHPERVALSWVPAPALAAFSGDLSAPLPHEVLTYGAFARLIAHTASGLAKLGIAPGDRVIIFLPMGVAMYVAMFAVQRLGAIAVFLDSWARSKHLGASAECVQPKAMISNRQAFELIKDVPELDAMPLRIVGGDSGGVSASARLEELMADPGEAPIAAVASEQTALITFTTGSTGTPKGANRTHRFLSAQHQALRRIIPYGPADLDLPAFPIFSLNNLASGVSTAVPALDLAAPSPGDPAALCNQIQHQRITCTTLSPSMFVGLAAFCTDRGQTLATLRRVVTGGAPISRDDLRGFRAIAPGADIWVLYGSTEVEPMAHIEAREMMALGAPSDPEIVEEGVNVGRLSDDLRCKFLRAAGDDGPIDLARTPWSTLEVPAGQIGELVVSGDHVCRDYYNNPEAFKRAKIVDADGTVWHRTGDLARLDEHGFLYVVGRVNNAVRRGDQFLFPVRAEVILKRVEQARQVAFLGLPDARLGQRAAVVLELADPAGEAARAAAVEEVRRLFAKNGIPVDDLFIVDAIPMDPRHHSKVEYEALRQRLLVEKVGIPGRVPS
jgi:cis-3-alkyl-4-acyloxetan-2-one decarboxylase / olefin beta-lactone synthetase